MEQPTDTVANEDTADTEAQSDEEDEALAQLRAEQGADDIDSDELDNVGDSEGEENADEEEAQDIGLPEDTVDEVKGQETKIDLKPPVSVVTATAAANPTAPSTKVFGNGAKVGHFGASTAGSGVGGGATTTASVSAAAPMNHVSAFRKDAPSAKYDAGLYLFELNSQFAEWVEKQTRECPSADLTPAIEDYKKHLREILVKAGL